MGSDRSVNYCGLYAWLHTYMGKAKVSGHPFPDRLYPSQFVGVQPRELRYGGIRETTQKPSERKLAMKRVSFNIRLSATWPSDF